MIRKVISGGQTGADQAGLYAAKSVNWKQVDGFPEGGNGSGVESVSTIIWALGDTFILPYTPENFPSILVEVVYDLLLSSRVVNIAGNRESISPGIQEWGTQILTGLFTGALYLFSVK